MMIKWLGHLRTITKHRHQVIRNGFHCGIFLHCLKHDLTKLSPTEFFNSAKNYNGHHSPVYEERKTNDGFSYICQHHTRRNKHHWEYWTDFFMGRIVVHTMPWVYATEYVCDMLSASKTYDPKNFGSSTALDYFLARVDRYFMTEATKLYVTWCLTRYRDLGFKGLRKKDTKAKYAEIVAANPKVEFIDSLPEHVDLPPFALNAPHKRM